MADDPDDMSRAARPPTHFRRVGVAGIGPNVRGKQTIGAAARAPALHLAPTRGAAHTVGTPVGAVGTTVGRNAAARGQHGEQRRSQLIAWLGLRLKLGSGLGLGLRLG